MTELAGLRAPPQGESNVADDVAHSSGPGAPYCMLELLEVMSELPDLERGYVSEAGPGAAYVCVRSHATQLSHVDRHRLTRIIQCSCTPVEAASTLVVFQRVLSVLPDPAVAADEVRGWP